MKSGSFDTANIGCILNCDSLMVKNARQEGRPPSACPSLYLYIWGNRPGPMVPDCGAYAIHLYPAGRLFSSKWVGAYCIRPIRRPRQGDECGFWVMSMGDLLGASGPYRSSVMGWGLAPTGPHMPIPICMGKSSGPYRSSVMGWGLAPTGPHMPIPICMGKSPGPCPSSAKGWGLAPTGPHLLFLS